MVLTQFLFAKSMVLSPHVLYNNQGTREGRKSMSFVKATTNPGLWLLPPPPSPSATSREGRLSLKAHTWVPTVPARAHFRCCAVLFSSLAACLKEAFTPSAAKNSTVELYSPVSETRTRIKKTHYLRVFPF